MAFPNNWQSGDTITASKLNEWNDKLSGFEKLSSTAAAARVGFVGFGTDAPSHPVHVNTTEAWQGFRADRNSVPFFAAYSDTAGNGEMVLSTAGGQNNVVLRASGDSVLAGGRVGIGTASPAEKLHVYSAEAVTRLLVEADKDQTFTSSEAVLKAWSGANICSGGILRGYSARGSKTSPTATSNPDRLLQLAGYGYTGLAAAIGAQIRFIAGSSWSGSNCHTDIYIDANGPNETATPTRFRLEGVGAFVLTAAPATPATPAASSEAKIYVKGSKLVVQYNDAGTVRYKYLDLAGTGVTWVHTTTAP